MTAADLVMEADAADMSEAWAEACAWAEAGSSSDSGATDVTLDPSANADSTRLSRRWRRAVASSCSGTRLRLPPAARQRGTA